MERKSFLLQALETRALMSVPTAYASFGSAGLVLKITGTTGSDEIHVACDDQGYHVDNGAGWSANFWTRFTGIIINALDGNDHVALDASVIIPATIKGGNGNDSLTGGSGNDVIFGGEGADLLEGGGGNDRLVDVGGGARDSLVGGEGIDSFWMDKSSTEKALDADEVEIESGALHPVSSFVGVKQVKIKKTAGGVSAVRLKAKTVNPKLGNGLRYSSFSNQPLFASIGPSEEDVIQGGVGDCYLMASLASTALADPNRIEQMITDLGDGTYAVRFYRGSVAKYVRVDSSLPMKSSGSLAYAQLGEDGSLWAALVEKAYAIFRGNGRSYAGLSGGFIEEADAAIGMKYIRKNAFASSGSMMRWLDDQLDAGKSVGIGTKGKTSGAVVGLHAYSVVKMSTDEDGNLTGVVLRNPWGVDGVKNASNMRDGYVTLSANQLYQSIWMGVSAG